MAERGGAGRTPVTAVRHRKLNSLPKARETPGSDSGHSSSCAQGASHEASSRSKAMSSGQLEVVRCKVAVTWMGMVPVKMGEVLSIQWCVDLGVGGAGGGGCSPSFRPMQLDRGHLNTARMTVQEQSWR